VMEDMLENFQRGEELHKLLELMRTVLQDQTLKQRLKFVWVEKKIESDTSIFRERVMLLRDMCSE
jgi:hypothetical protein